MTPPDNDLDVLMPDRTLTVGGENIDVRELTFRQELEAQHTAAALLHDVGALYGTDEPPTFAQLESLFGKHAEVVVQLLSTSTGRPAAWIEALPAAEGQVLLLTWWSINRGFFLRRVVASVAARRAAAPSAGAPSSPP